MIVNRPFAVQMLCALSLSAVQPVQAQANAGGNPTLEQRFQLSVGGFVPFVDSTIRVDSPALGEGTVLDLERQLALAESRPIAWAAARWRPSRRNEIAFEWVQLNRSATIAGITEDVQVGDSVLQAGGEVATQFDVGLYRLTYGRTLVHRERTRFQLQAGIHLADPEISFGLTGVLSVDGDVFQQSFSTVRAGITAPLPHLGASVAHAFSEKLSVRGHAMGFALEISDISGSIIDSGISAEYSFNDHVGAGAGARFFRVDVDDNGGSSLARYEFNYVGPVFFLFGMF